MLELAEDQHFRTKLKKFNLNILIILIITFFLIFMYLYKDCSLNAERESNQILQNQYTKIVEIIDRKLSSLGAELNQNIHDRNVLIKPNVNHLEICTNTNNCINYSISRFGALLNRYIPEYIYYKIDINNQFVYTNTKFSKASLKKAYHINNNSQFNISLAINPDYLLHIENSIKRPFWILIILVLLIIVIFIVINHLISKKLSRFSSNFYNQKYSKELELIKLSYQQEIKNNIGILKKKIWENEFKYQKDLEINNIFAKKIKEISLINNLSEIIEEKHTTDSLLIPHLNITPCSMVVYQNGNIEKDINVERLMELFVSRFKEESNTIVSITSEIAEVNFSSTAALYQIIYSLLKYLIFILDNQLETTKQNIKLYINNVNNMVSLKFEYDGVCHESKIDFLKRENYFFKTHSNPFILNPSQIFSLLERDEFETEISYASYNIIEIKKSIDKNLKNFDGKKNNVIVLTSFNRKKYE